MTSAAASPSFATPRRSATVPTRLQPPQQPRSELSEEPHETLFEHLKVNVYHFPIGGSFRSSYGGSRNPQVAGTLPYKSPMTETIAGLDRPLRLCKPKTGAPFLQAGTKAKEVRLPMMPTTEVWCVEGDSTFATNVLQSTYRIQFPHENGSDRLEVEKFKDALRKVVMYEPTDSPCPFRRELKRDDPTQEEVDSPQRRRRRIIQSVDGTIPLSPNGTSSKRHSTSLGQLSHFRQKSQPDADIEDLDDDSPTEDDATPIISNEKNYTQHDEEQQSGSSGIVHDESIATTSHILPKPEQAVVSDVIPSEDSDELQQRETPSPVALEEQSDVTTPSEDLSPEPVIPSVSDATVDAASDSETESESEGEGDSEDVQSDVQAALPLDIQADSKSTGSSPLDGEHKLDCENSAVEKDTNAPTAAPTRQEPISEEPLAPEKLPPAERQGSIQEFPREHISTPELATNASSRSAVPADQPSHLSTFDTNPADPLPSGPTASIRQRSPPSRKSSSETPRSSPEGHALSRSTSSQNPPLTRSEPNTYILTKVIDLLTSPPSKFFGLLVDIIRICADRALGGVVTGVGGGVVGRLRLPRTPGRWVDSEEDSEDEDGGITADSPIASREDEWGSEGETDDYGVPLGNQPVARAARRQWSSSSTKGAEATDAQID